MAQGREEANPTKVPITFDGFEIGSGFVSSDGYVTIIRLNDSYVAQEIQARLRERPVSISINPRN